MAGHKASPRTVCGRCSQCAHFDISDGSTRVRAMQLSGTAWSEDPACYLSDAEIGIADRPEEGKPIQQAIT